MRLIADEHVSHRIVHAINDLARLPGDWVFEAVVKSKYAGMEDEDWVEAFARDGGNGLLSADRKMLDRPTLVSAISKTGLVAIYFPTDFAEGGPATYSGKGRLYQMAYTAYWWTEIQRKFETAGSGTAWATPKSLGGGELREIATA